MDVGRHVSVQRTLHAGTVTVSILRHFNAILLHAGFISLEFEVGKEVIGGTEHSSFSGIIS